MTRPVRLRLSRRKGFDLQAWSREVNGLPAVNVARPSRYGNPFVVGTDGTRAECVRFFALAVNGLVLASARRSAATDALTLASAGRRWAREIRGHNVGCWCELPALGSPDICHGAVWLVLADDEKPAATLAPLIAATNPKERS